MVDLEALAEEAATDIEHRPEPQERPKPIPCGYCGATGRERSKWAWLWGGTCWVCGGWGYLIGDPLKLRGPFVPEPYRYAVRGGSDDHTSTSGDVGGNRSRIRNERRRTPTGGNRQRQRRKR